MNEKDILTLIKKDSWMMEVLNATNSLHLPDWWIGAGFVRGKVWDHLHDYKTRTPLPDIDVIYFDPTDFEKDEMHSESTKMENIYEVELSKLIPNVKWSVTNQARMHVFHKGDRPYNNSTEALSRWVETATCIGVSLDRNNKLKLIAPHGIGDLVSLKLCPVIVTPEGLKTFQERIRIKNWLSLWPKLTVDNI